MSKKKYLEKKEIIQIYDLYDLEGSLDRIISIFTNLKEKTKDYRDILVDVDCWEESAELQVMGTRQETDEERNKRLEKNKKERELKKRKKQEYRAKIEKEARRLGII